MKFGHGYGPIKEYQDAVKNKSNAQTCITKVMVTVFSINRDHYFCDFHFFRPLKKALRGN